MKEFLGDRIKHFRALKDISQKDLSSAMGAHFQTISGWENGRSWPEYPQLEALAKHLGVEIFDFFSSWDAAGVTHPEPTPQQALEVLAKAINQPRAVEKASPLVAELLSAAAPLDEDQLRRFIRNMRVASGEIDAKSLDDSERKLDSK